MDLLYIGAILHLAGFRPQCSWAWTRRAAPHGIVEHTSCDARWYFRTGPSSNDGSGST
jgi:hypothetical protein